MEVKEKFVLIENLTDVEITIYKSTVVLVGDADGLALARQAVEMIAGGSEHGSVLSFLERSRKRMKFDNRFLEYIETRQDTVQMMDSMVLFPALLVFLNEKADACEQAKLIPMTMMRSTK